MSYVKSLRFKLMLLCVIPLLAAAALFIAHSVIIAYQVRDITAAAYEAASAPAADIQESIDMSWIARQWVIVFIGMFVCFYIPITLNIKGFIMPIRELAREADKLAEGDVDIEIAKNRDDELGVLQESFQRLVAASGRQAELIRQIADGDLTGSYTPRSDADVVGQSLVEMLKRNNEALMGVMTGTEQFKASATQIAQASQMLAQGATEQAATIQGLSEDAARIALQVNDSAERSRQAAALSEEILDNARTGSDKMSNMLEAVREISETSLSINNVINVIDGIAFQTNILALNASVEAARAGQHGKGFSVVADEVRNLAVKSAAAAKDTGALIASSVDKARLGERIAQETAESLTQIVDGIGQSNSLIRDISAYADTQAAAVENINTGIGQVSQVVQQNSATAEESAAASEEMSGQAEILSRTIAQFKLNA